MKEISHIIVQAGGKGTRMQKLTHNKPKALVPVQNLPMLFHLFRSFPNKKFVIIGDYKYDVLARYLTAFASVHYTLVRGTDYSGTCAGLGSALQAVPEESAFMLIWSDLVLPTSFSLPPLEENNYIGIAKDFRCRWSFHNGELMEEPSETQGVAGCFVFRDKAVLKDVPVEGEFVRYLKGKHLRFKEIPLVGTREYGLIEEYSRLPQYRCRPFNKLTIREDVIIKEGIDAQGKELAVREKAWYTKISNANFMDIPRIYSYEPLTLERIRGKNIHEYSGLTKCQKQDILESLIDRLKKLHAIERIPSDFSSFEDAYIGKTMRRLDKVRNLVPFANDPEITVNGRKCRNVFLHLEKIHADIKRFFPAYFELLHGDCTFSNAMLRDETHSPVLIDPRGYFGTTELFGDPAYEWAKLYYSIVGNYDQFNLKRFDLSINEKDVLLSIESNGWEDMERVFFSLLEDEISEHQIKLIHAIIWLSLTTYTWEDYDSICGAFYNGLYYLEEVL